MTTNSNLHIHKRTTSIRLTKADYIVPLKFAQVPTICCNERVRADAKENRSNIIKSASELLIEQGDAVSMRSVASAAGVGMGTLYRHFSNREELFAGIASDTFERIAQSSQRVLDEHEDLTEEVWSGLVRDLVGMRLGALGPILRTAWDEFGPDVFAYRDRAFKTFGTVLAKAQSAGLVAADVTAVAFIVGILQISRPLPAVNDEDFAGIDDWLVGVYLRGMRP